MAAFNKFNSFVEAVGRKVHNLNADSLKLMLSNAAPSAANTQKTDITDISAGNGYSAGGAACSGVSFVQSGGVAKLLITDIVFTAAGGSIGPFRYAVLYNDTATNKELIGYWDYGSSITLLTGETFTVDFDGTNGVLTIT